MANLGETPTKQEPVKCSHNIKSSLDFMSHIGLKPFNWISTQIRLRIPHMSLWGIASTRTSPVFLSVKVSSVLKSVPYLFIFFHLLRLGSNLILWSMCTFSVTKHGFRNNFDDISYLHDSFNVCLWEAVKRSMFTNKSKNTERFWLGNFSKAQSRFLCADMSVAADAIWYKSWWFTAYD